MKKGIKEQLMCKMILSGLIVLFVCVFSSIGFTEPALSLYVDGADYYDDCVDAWFTDSYVTFDSEFTLLVEMFQRGNEDGKAWSPYFCDMHLVVAVPEGETGGISINGVDLVISHSGMPTYDGFEMTPPHGVYPTPYSLYPILIGSRNCLIDGEDDPIPLVINWGGYSKVHFDVFAFNKYEGSEDGAWVVNPFSHDVTATNPVPEPASMMLFGTGLLGLVGFGKRKFFS